ncbi:heterokaryon incompatibility protein-domain-containing protein [Suillus subaureus]|uniref:Heterokaryon incompatibility protein-domain-containing protein n=1 Tax=Suillus subaureus TaxID=48587 RepID=A0A9P7JEX4_9AGAM|nr:heterokaryon incompatibility protein-domain-containing protein [Suillus subaureus]KAG1818216.1 heterokaryon incompatibility protein-domain-containing protein [Suillus subaureus]
MTRLSLGSLYITHLLSARDREDPAIPEWNASTQKQFGQPLKTFPLLRHPISRHFAAKAQASNSEGFLINAKSVAIQPSSATSLYMSCTLSPTWTPDRGTLLEWNTSESASTWKQVTHSLAGPPIASTFFDSQVGLQRLSDRRTFTTFQRSVVTLSVDNTRILSGCQDKIISEWVAPKDALQEKPASIAVSDPKILAINTKTVTIQPSSILNSVSSTIFANRSKAKLEKSLWEDALVDAQRVIELEPSSHVGYQLKHTALHGVHRYSEAIEAFQIMLAKLDSAHGTQIRKLREKYVGPSRAEGVIRKFIDIQLYTAPLRLLNTSSGLLCDREAQISVFKTTAEYKQLLLSIMNHADLSMERIADVVATYFRYVMLSHRWGENEPLLHDIQDKVVYKLKAAGSLVKLQSFCKSARHAGYHWAWVDTCCIDQNNNVELQKSFNSMFVWYHHSALTTVYLSDVPPSAKSGALAKSAWNTRGWTVPEFLASRVILFYQQDWMLYLDDRSPNHKESVEIMHELEDATGIDARVLVAFQPGMRDARQKLQWVSTRVTTVPEDIAYSLFGIFGVALPILYGENAQNALGRLLQEIVARSGDITALDWVGQPSEFNSCLPAHISSYAAPPCSLPYLSEDEIQTAVSSLRHTAAVDQASKFYDRLDNMSAPRFASCRLRLPCIVFPVTEVRRRSGPAQEALFTYGVRADGLDDLSITTEENLIQFSRPRPTRRTFLLVHPWDRRLLELPDIADDAECLGDRPQPESLLDDSDSISDSPGEAELADSESYSRALRLIVRLGQPFGAFLLAQQRGGEYKRIASDHDIIAQVKDVSSAHTMMDIRTLEIL